MKLKEFIFETFLRLTSKTCPYGHEDKFVDQFRKLFPKDLQKDEWGNYFVKIGESRTIFASHIDTVSKEYLPVTHVIKNDIISTDGKTTLGADDKAGVTVMLWMIQNNVPGLYYFFIGEEVGCIGSGKAAKYGKFSGNYDRIISFDRRGTSSIITYQSSQRCCSENFGKTLAKELTYLGINYKTDDTGVYTDSAEFMDIIPECTNISVGYYKEHTFDEYQDINHLTLLADACTKIVWDSLPVERNPKDSEYKSWTTYSQYGTRSYDYHDDWHESNTSFFVNQSSKKRKRNRKNRRYVDSGKKFYTYGSELKELDEFSQYSLVDDWSEPNSSNRYDWIFSKFIDSNLTLDELDVIKDQYLDMNDTYDRYFWEYLLESHFEN